MTDTIMIHKEYERRIELFRYLDIPNTDQANISKKWYGLRTMGWTEEQCEAECRPKEIDIVEVLKSVREASREEQRALAKYNREQAKLRDEAGLYREAGQSTSAPESIIERVDGFEGGLGV